MALASSPQVTHFIRNTTRDTRHPTHDTLHPTPYTLHSTHYSLHAAHYTPHSTQPRSPKLCRDGPGLVPAGLFVLHRTPCTITRTPQTLHPTPYTIHLTPCTIHPTHYILHPTKNNTQGLSRLIPGLFRGKLVALGAILWAFIAERFQKLTFDAGWKDPAWSPRPPRRISSKSLFVLIWRCYAGFRTVTDSELVSSTDFHSSHPHGMVAARTQDAQGTPTQSHISPSILVCEEKHVLIYDSICQDRDEARNLYEDKGVHSLKEARGP